MHIRLLIGIGDPKQGLPSERNLEVQVWADAGKWLRKVILPPSQRHPTWKRPSGTIEDLNFLWMNQQVCLFVFSWCTSSLYFFVYWELSSPGQNYST